MQIVKAEITSGLRLSCLGNVTRSAQATLGGVFKDGSADPGEGFVFTGWSGSILVTGTSHTATVNLLDGSATANAGTPNISELTNGDWEGNTPLPAQYLRAIRIEDIGGTVTRTLKVTLGNGEFMLIPKKGSLLLTAQGTDYLPSEYHNMGFSATTPTGQSWVRITCLGVAAD